MEQTIVCPRDVIPRGREMTHMFGCAGHGKGTARNPGTETLEGVLCVTQMENRQLGRVIKDDL